MPIHIQHFKTPIGELLLGAYNDTLCICDWRYRKMRSSIDKRIKDGLNAEFQEGDTPVLKETRQQLTEYFEGERKTFELPLLFVGTSFQKLVWEALKQIPFGQTETYLGLSQKLGDEKAIRAVASANGANALAIIIPCHRVIGSHGELVGYAGGMDTKKKLLRLEGSWKVAEQMQLFNG